MRPHCFRPRPPRSVHPSVRVGTAALLLSAVIACAPTSPGAPPTSAPAAAAPSVASGAATQPAAPATSAPTAVATKPTAAAAASPAGSPVTAAAASPAPAASPATSAAAGGPVSRAPILTSADVPAAVKDACQASKSPKIAEIQKRGSLAWGIGVSPPFGFKQPNGEWAGVEVDNAQELANILGVGKDTIQDFDYSLMTTALQSNQVDIVGAQLFITPARAQVIDFSAPYYLSGQVFYVLDNSRFKTIDDLNSPENHFVYGTGGGQKDLADKYIPKAQISDAPLRGQLILYEFLVTGQADSTMGESAPLKVLKSQYRNPQLAAIGLKGRINSDHASDDEILDPFQVAFGIAQGDAGFKACVDSWVNEAKQAGRMQQRLDYWLAQNVAG